ncbi:prophage LambdaSo, portal, HK97 family domain protein [Pseudomonas aeruginosa]|nr:prophage LambdaSo, portal, HK97 family domain protein [Pseudomonas aeruginosa]
MQRVLNKEQRSEFRESLAEVSGAINAGKSPLLEAGWMPRPSASTPRRAAARIARFQCGGGLPVVPRSALHGWPVGKSTTWGTGLEQQMIGFLTFTISRG